MSSSIIKKITVGADPKDGFTYLIGGKYFRGSIKITSIEEVVKNEVYSIYVKKGDSTAEVHWKNIVGMPVTVEYNIDDY
jgi:hypothetical protein